MRGRPRYQVVILGGGPAGCAVALSLARQGVDRVLIVEASDYGVERVGESIPPDTRGLFAELGVLDEFLVEHHESCLGSHSSWGADELGYNDFVFSVHGHGWHLDRRRFDAWMAARAEAAGVELWTGCSFVDRADGRGPERSVELGIRTGGRAGASTQVRAEFVVDATGQRARYARRCGARHRELDRLAVTWGYFEVPDGSLAGLSRLTLLEAVEYGWWYMARLPRGRVAAAVATSAAIHKRRRFDRASGWLEALGETRYVLARLLEAEASPIPGSLSVCAAPSSLLDPIVDASADPRWLAAGDAASCFDPISSQGIYKGLSDGLEGGQAVAAHLRGDGTALSEYAAHVRGRFSSYMQQRAYFYGVEQRWPDASFWRERVDASAWTGREKAPAGPLT